MWEQGDSIMACVSQHIVHRHTPQETDRGLALPSTVYSTSAWSISGTTTHMHSWIRKYTGYSETMGLSFEYVLATENRTPRTSLNSLKWKFTLAKFVITEKYIPLNQSWQCRRASNSIFFLAVFKWHLSRYLVVLPWHKSQCAVSEIFQRAAGAHCHLGDYAEELRVKSCIIGKEFSFSGAGELGPDELFNLLSLYIYIHKAVYKQVGKISNLLCYFEMLLYCNLTSSA